MFIGASMVQGQNICFTDEQHQKYLEESTEHRTHFFGMNDLVLDEILASRSGDESSSSFTIPTVVHIIHNNGPENISSEQAEQAVEWLNNAFSNTENMFHPDGIEIPIQLCLAGTDPDGNLTDGINYVQSDLTNMLVPSQDQELKDVVRWNTNDYFNIWVVNTIEREDNSPGVIGYATFPDSHGQDNDGIVIEAEYFGSTSTANAAFIHECGHYLGLYHTFQDGCPNDDCLTSGDRVCDTPPDQALFNFFCFDGTNSCATDEDDTSTNNPFRATDLGGLGDQIDLQANYMDYSGLHCFQWFTAGQSERMLASLSVMRQSLFDEDKCSTPCTADLTPNVTASSSVINVGETVSFTDFTEGVTSTEWLVDGVLQGGETTFNFSPNDQGTYLVEAHLTNSDPGCLEIIPFTILVECPVSIVLFPNATNFSEGGSITVSTESTGASSIDWYVDNEFIESTDEFTYTFNELGVFSIYAIASNGTCDVTSAVWNISVGSCTSGNEHNIWHWFNETGIGYGFDFNTNPPEILSTNPSVGIGHCKATICDQAGNLRYVSTGEEVYDMNYGVLQNGDGLMGNISSHFGTSFLKAPGSETDYYLFTTSSFEEDFSNGLRYSIIDSEANGGLGAVTAIKNVLVETTGTEHHNTIKHCNLVDNWLVFYDVPEESFKAYLITEDGISDAPVETSFSIPNAEDINLTSPLAVSPQGNKIMYDKYLLEFNQSTGSFSLIHEFEVDALTYEFSPNGKILYLFHGEVEITIWQIDLTVPSELMAPNAVQIELELLDIGVGLTNGPDNIMYYEKTFTGAINTINSPNLLGEAMDYEENTYFSNALINSFGNFHHGYISGKDIFIDGDEIICAGTDHEFSIYDSECIDSDIEWEFFGDGDFTVNPNETVSASFPAVGAATLVAKTTTGCGELTDTLHISIIQGPDLDLGPDLGYCAGDSEITLEIPSEFEFYLWSTGSIEQSITLDSPGPQIIEARGYYQGCYITDEIEILGELSGTIDLGPDTDLCDGDAIILDAGPGFSDYLWQDGSTNQTFTAFLGGTYSVSVTQPCAATDIIFIDECGQSVGISEEDELTRIRIYPNPAADEVTVPISRNSTLEKIEIIDSTGKVVEIITATSAGNTVTFDVKHLSRGEYKFKIYLGSEIIVEKVILN